MTDRKRRTPEEIIADHEAKLSRLRAQQAMKDAEANPSLAPALECLTEVDKAIREAQKGFGSGPQSFEVRRQSHQLWVDEIDAAQQLAIVTLERSRTLREKIRTTLADFTTCIAEGEEVMADAVTLALEEITWDSEAVEEATANLAHAKQARVGFNETKRAPKRQKSEEEALEA